MASASRGAQVAQGDGGRGAGDDDACVAEADEGDEEADALRLPLHGADMG